MAKNKLWLLILILILVALAFHLVCLFRLVLNKGETPAKVKQFKIESDEFIGLILKIPGSEKNGHWKLQVVQLESQDDIGQMKQIEGDYLLNKKPLYHLSAESGTIYWKTRILKVNGHVNFKTEDGKELLAEEVSWDPNSRRILAQNKVVLKSPGLTVSTEKFDGELNLERAVMSGTTKVFYQR